MTTPNMGLTEVPSNSLQPSAPINESLQALDALVIPGGRVQEITATPPTTVLGDEGKLWLIDDSATGVWVGKDGQLALCTAAAVWRYFTAGPGWLAHNLDDGDNYRSDGAGTWVLESGGGGGGAVDSVNGDTGTVIVLSPIIVACSDETTALTTGTAKVTFRTPYAMTLTGVKASVNTAPTGSVLTVDINEGGTSILSTKLTIDATEKTSATAATPAVISDTALAADAEITIDIDTVGSTVAGSGLKVTFLGYAS